MIIEGMACFEFGVHSFSPACIRTGAHESIELVFADCCWHSGFSYVKCVWLRKRVKSLLDSCFIWYSI